MAGFANKTLIIVPAWNEELSLATVLTEIRASAPVCEILVIDDGSTDSTAQIADQHADYRITLPFNMGVGGAMRTGYSFANKYGFTHAVQIDADGQHNPRDLPRLIGKLDSSDIVIGARFAGVGNYEVRGPRKWAMLVLSKSLSKLSGNKLSDTTSGYRACGPNAISLFARDYPAEYLGDTVGALVIAIRNGLRVSQVGVSMRPRLAGLPSQNQWKSAMSLLRTVVALSLALLRYPSATRRGI